MNVVLGVLLVIGLVSSSVLFGYALADTRHHYRQVFVPPALWPNAVHTVFDLSQLATVDQPDRDPDDHPLVEVVHDARTARYTLIHVDGTRIVLDGGLHQVHRNRVGRWRRTGPRRINPSAPTPKSDPRL